eukprot:Awhi_evm1s13192
MPIVGCLNRMSCDGYHDMKERRRHPDVYDYTPEPCCNVFSKTLSSWGLPSACPSGDECKQSHTLMEVMYHREKYKTRVCERWVKPLLKCSWSHRCAYKHGDDDVNLGYTSKPLSLMEKRIDNDERRAPKKISAEK